MKYVYCWIFVTVLLAFSSETYAQSHDRQVRTRVDSVLTARWRLRLQLGAGAEVAATLLDATLVMNNSVFDDDLVVVNQNKWRARLSIGMRL